MFIQNKRTVCSKLLSNCSSQYVSNTIAQHTSNYYLFQKISNFPTCQEILLSQILAAIISEMSGKYICFKHVSKYYPQNVNKVSAPKRLTNNYLYFWEGQDEKLISQWWTNGPTASLGWWILPLVRSFGPRTCAYQGMLAIMVSGCWQL